MGTVAQFNRERTREHDAKREIERMALTMVATVPNQETLDHVLLQEPNVERRRLLFEFMKPALRFENPVFPVRIA